MKILFIDPPFKRFTGLDNPFFPLGLAYLSAVCNQNGHKAVVYEVDAAEKTKTTDMDFSHEHQKLELYKNLINDSDNPIWAEIINVVKDYNPEVIGITVMTTKIASAIRTADILKKELADVPILFGGPHATLLPEQCLKVDSVDYVMRGESERTILQFLSFIDGDIELSDVNNLSHTDESGKIVHNLMEKPIKNLDEIPFPDRDSLLYKNNYTSEDMGLMMTTRGCPFNCAYCAHIFGRKVRKRSIENVLEEIRLVKRNYDTTQFSFKDDTFILNKKMVIQLCNKLIEEDLGINWVCTTRVDLIDDKVIKLIKKAGCNEIRVGVETGSQRILDNLKKGITFEQVRTASEIFNKNRILWSAYFMYGLPTETVEDIRKTYKFMEELNSNYAGLGLYSPFPKTDLFDEGVELGLLEDDIEIDHFFNTNPKDYYFKDPGRRVLDIEPEEFLTIEREVQEAFSKHNTKFSNLARRALSRKSNYIKHPIILIRDVSKGIKMLGKGYI
jgi:radical SAM superfamily enzyme YgiQ (UPF0313 family)